MSDLIERAAKAAFDAMRDRMVSVGWLGTVAWESESEELREDWRAAAAAAIDTMPVPGSHLGGHFERTGTGRGNRRFVKQG